jgi:hypothetical protein
MNAEKRLASDQREFVLLLSSILKNPSVFISGKEPRRVRGGIYKGYLVHGGLQGSREIPEMYSLPPLCGTLFTSRYYSCI